jgi:hypothetical protein
MRAQDIVEAKLGRLEVTLKSFEPYHWSAEARMDSWIFTGSGFTPGEAVSSLYSVMLRHYDRTLFPARAEAILPTDAAVEQP